jgi:hypothetical protein
MAAFLMLGVALPNLALWLAERASKSAFLEARGLRLRVRPPLPLPCLGGSGAGARAAGALSLPTATVAAAAVLWWLALGLVNVLSPQCRGAL